MLSEREGRHSGNKADLGSLRLKINYVEDWVFPSRSYDQLRKLIVNSIDCNVSKNISFIFTESRFDKSVSYIFFLYSVYFYFRLYQMT